jgi:hypothetical protein
MAQKRIKVSDLKGRKLYNYLVKELGIRNKKLPKKQQMGIAKRRRIVSQEIFPKYKNLEKFTLKQINSELNSIIKSLPPEEICNPLYLPESYLAFIPYYDIDNHIRSVLPDCLDIKISAGAFGQTKVFNTMRYSYQGDGIRKIVEKIRDNMGNLDSGSVPYFSGIVELKYRGKNNGNPDNYYVDYILYIDNEPIKEDIGIDYELPSKEQKKVNEINNFLAQKFKTLQKEKKKRKRIAKNKEVKKPAEQKKEITQAVRKAINSLKLLVKKGVITEQQFEKQKQSILAYKNKK